MNILDVAYFKFWAYLLYIHTHIVYIQQMKLTKSHQNAHE